MKPLFEYPFDAELLKASKLYRRSRELYLTQGGEYRPVLVSAARTLSSPILLENTIEYTPIASELSWEKDRAKAVALCRFVSSVFHEQNHRVLWKRLPAAPKSRESVRRYLNFSESLVITADMALADELGPKRAARFHAANLIYDPGTTVRRELKNRRAYRNYLQACVHGTYLTLEAYKPGVVAQALRLLYSNVEQRMLKRAVARATSLNQGFVTKTNLAWQHKNFKKVVARLGGKNPLELDDHPLHNIEQYRIAESWFDEFGL